MEWIPMARRFLRATKKEMEEILRGLGGKVGTGTKADVAERLRQALEAMPDGAEMRHRIEDVLWKKSTKKELQGHLAERGLSTSGDKAALTARLRAAREQHGNGNDDKANVGDNKSLEQGAVLESATDKEASPKKRKRWRFTDPAEIPPNYYHADLFQANFPLVSVTKVRRGEPLPVLDKFRRTQYQILNDDIREVWSLNFCRVHNYYRDCNNEKQSFPHHMALIHGLTPFTLPSPSQAERTVSMFKQFEALTGKSLGSTGDHQRVSTSGGQEGEQLCGLNIELAVESPLGCNTDSDISVEEELALLEGSLMEDGEEPTDFADAVLHVYDERPLKRQRSGADGYRVPLVLKRQHLSDGSKLHAMYQGGFYAVKYCLLNLFNGHGTPIYVLVMAKDTWTYGILVPEGCVQIRDGDIDPTSMAAFREHQEITGRCGSDMRTLQERLVRGTAFYRKNYQDNPTATYCDGPVLVGDFFLVDEWYPLPVADVRGFQSQASSKLLSGLLRILLGESVVEMTTDQLMDRVAQNDKILELKNYCMNH